MIISLTSIGIKAHEIDISTIILAEQEDTSWTLQIRSPLVAFQREVKSNFSESPYTSVDEFKEQLLQHLQNTLTISIDEQDLVLGQGIVQLGHESGVFFKGIKLPKNIRSLQITNNTFRSIYGNKTAFFVLDKEANKGRYILDKTNNHTIKLGLNKSGAFVENKQTIENSSFSFVIKSIIVFLLLLGVFVFIVRIAGKKNYVRMSY